LPPGQFTRAFSEPDRYQLYARSMARYEAMLSAGALEEVAALAARRLDPLLPAMNPWRFRADPAPQGEISLHRRR